MCVPPNPTPIEFLATPHGMDDVYNVDHTTYEAQALVFEHNQSADGFVDPIQITLAESVSTFTMALLNSVETPRYYIIVSQHEPETTQTILLWTIWTTKNTQLMSSSGRGQMLFAQYLDARGREQWEGYPREQIKDFPIDVQEAVHARWKQCNLTFAMLPKELRDKIIYDAIAPPAVIEPKQPCDRGCSQSLPPIGALAAINKEFRAQTYFVVYSQSTFRFRNLVRYDVFMSSLLDDREISPRKMIRSVEISFSTTELEHFFRDGITLSAISKCPPDISALSGLRRLCIDVSNLRRKRSESMTRCTLYLIGWNTARRCMDRASRIDGPLDVRFKLGLDGPEEEGIKTAWDLEKHFIRRKQGYYIEDLESVIIAHCRATISALEKRLETQGFCAACWSLMCDAIGHTRESGVLYPLIANYRCH